jgi:hypothetical protein
MKNQLKSSYMKNATGAGQHGTVTPLYLLSQGEIILKTNCPRFDGADCLIKQHQLPKHRQK